MFPFPSGEGRLVGLGCVVRNSLWTAINQPRDRRNRLLAVNWCIGGRRQETRCGCGLSVILILRPKAVVAALVTLALLGELNIFEEDKGMSTDEAF